MDLVVLTLLTVPLVFIPDGKTKPEHRKLPPPATTGKLSLEEAVQKRRSIREYADAPLSMAETGQLLWAAQGVTDRRGGYRAAPSAGATYPLSVLLVAGNVKGLEPGVYRYLPAEHALTRMQSGDIRKNLCSASLNQRWVKEAPAIIVLAADYGRTAGRYGPRATRYVDIEVGHAAQNVYLQATALGLGTVAVGAFDDDAVKKLLPLQKNEVPLYLMPVGKKK
jgi:SagB-type dehydrogenase family enzyme